MNKTFSLMLLIVAVGISGCGDEGNPRPGVIDPCQTAAGPVLGCSAAFGTGIPSTAASGASLIMIQSACQKLVDCGILAGENFSRSGDKCTTNENCRSNICRETSEGKFCHSHSLDFSWCVGEFSSGGQNPCSDRTRFSAIDIENALRCVSQTACTQLGLDLSQKRQGSDQRPKFDSFRCENGNDEIWTATVCDRGLLRY